MYLQQQRVKIKIHIEYKHNRRNASSYCSLDNLQQQRVKIEIHIEYKLNSTGSCCSLDRIKYL